MNLKMNFGRRSFKILFVLIGVLSASVARGGGDTSKPPFPKKSPKPSKPRPSKTPRLPKPPRRGPLMLGGKAL